MAKSKVKQHPSIKRSKFGRVESGYGGGVKAGQLGKGFSGGKGHADGRAPFRGGDGHVGLIGGGKPHQVGAGCPHSERYK